MGSAKCFTVVLIFRVCTLVATKFSLLIYDLFSNSRSLLFTFVVSTSGYVFSEYKIPNTPVSCFIVSLLSWFLPVVGEQCCYQDCDAI